MPGPHLLSASSLPWTALAPLDPGPTADRRPPLLLHVFSTFAVGGPQVRTAGLIAAFGERYRHVVLPLDGRTSCRERLPADAPVSFLDPPRGGGLPARLRAIGAVLDAQSPDLLLTYNWGAIEWALANRLGARRPHIHFEEGFGPDEAERQKRRRILFRRLALTGPTQVVVPSRTLETIARERWRLDPARVVRIDNGVDLGRFTAPPIANVVPVVGTVAPLRAEKNLGRLLRAAALAMREADFRLHIAGDGPERQRMEAQAAELGLGDRIRFLGHVAGAERVLPGFDLFALSSDTEQLPTTVIEAMAAGKAVAAVDVGDVAEMVAPENRPFVVARDDEAALARALATLITDPDRRAALGAANRLRAAERYDAARMAATYRSLLDGALAGAPGAGTTAGSRG